MSTPTADAAGVRTVSLADVAAMELPGGSWSRMLITHRTVTGNASSLGYSIFKPGVELAPVRHETEELAFVVAGQGELRVMAAPGEPAERVTVVAGSAVFIPARTWHAVANPGASELIMVFTFPHPDYPPTTRP